MSTCYRGQEKNHNILNTYQGNIDTKNYLA